MVSWSQCAMEVLAAELRSKTRGMGKWANYTRFHTKTGQKPYPVRPIKGCTSRNPDPLGGPPPGLRRRFWVSRPVSVTKVSCLPEIQDNRILLVAVAWQIWALVKTGMIDYEKFSERREQKTPNSIHKMVPHGKWAFTKEVEEERNVVSLAAVFWMSRTRCVTSRKRLRGRTKRNVTGKTL